MKIQVYVREIYGKVIIYPQCEQAKLFCSLLGQKTLTAYNLKLIQRLGYLIEQVPTFKIGV